MSNIIPNEEVLVPFFNINDGTGKTLKQRFDETKELRKNLAENTLKDYYADEQKMINEFCKEYKK